MKFQIFLALAVIACAFADEVAEDLKLDAVADVIEEPKIEAVDDVKIEAEFKDDKVEVKEDFTEIPLVSDPIPVESEDKEGILGENKEDDLKDLTGPIIFEWSSVYRTHDIDAAMPVVFEWPSNWMDFINALHGDGLELIPENPDLGVLNLSFPPAF